MAKKEPNQNRLSSVQNAMGILRLFKANKSEWSITDIAHEKNLPKSTVHRLVSTMVKEGFLSKNPRTNRYRLGLSILYLGGVIFSHRQLYKEALPVVRRLVQTLGESGHICFLENDEVVYLFRVENDNPVRLLTYTGRKNPFHCTSEGLAILAFQDEKRINAALELPLYAFTEETITDPAELKKELRRIYENGYAISKNHYYNGFVGIASPIRDHSGQVVASLSIIGPTSRVTEDRYPFFIENITNAAAEISELLGYFPEA
jgi:DNA-binding IclR family transcriptional regulator